MRQLSDCHKSFQATMKRIGDVAGKAPEDVYALWRQYSATCDASDQSAIAWEFVQWYTKDLGGDVDALLAVV